MGGILSTPPNTPAELHYHSKRDDCRSQTNNGKRSTESREVDKPVSRRPHNDSIVVMAERRQEIQ